MNKGDTIGLALDFTYNDEPLIKNGYDEIELQFEPQGNRNSLKLLYSEGRIAWDDEKGKYVAIIDQEETMKLPDFVKYQLRVKIGETVSSSQVGVFNLGELLSRRIL